MSAAAELRRPRRLVVLVAAGLLIAGLVAGALLTRRGGDASPASPGVHGGLCAALEEATAGDTEAARAVFYDRAHDGLHVLASRVADVDRRVAARLLQVKERVEAALDRGDAGAVARDLRSLVSAEADASAATGAQEARSCP